MIEIDLSDPWKHGTIAIAVCNVIGEAIKDTKGHIPQGEFRPLIKNLLKNKYNYDIEFILDKKGSLSRIKINTDEVFFILKHS
jgi:hypothetical protein